MNEKAYILVLALIFVLHNAEEYLFYHRLYPSAIKAKLMENRFASRFINPGVLLHATLFLDILFTSIALFNYFFDNEILKALTRVIFFGISINALWHITVSLWFRKFLAGTFTAIFLTMPFSVIYLVKLHENVKVHLCGLMRYAFWSLIAMLLLIPISFYVGYLLMKINKRSSS